MTERADWLTALDEDDAPLPVAHGAAWDHLRRVAMTLERIEVADVQVLARAILAARTNRRMVFVAGNGGSAAIASHFACDLQKVVRVRAIALTDNVPLITAWANDASYREVFAQQFAVLADSRDTLIVISCSGTSGNVVAVNAQEPIIPITHPMHSYAIFGEHGREAAQAYSGAVVIPARDYQVIEDCAAAVCHAVISQVAAK